jgi:hypothetical protein
VTCSASSATAVAVGTHKLCSYPAAMKLHVHGYHEAVRARIGLPRARSYGHGRITCSMHMPTSTGRNPECQRVCMLLDQR